MKKLLIYSGGLDSTVALYNYKEDIKLAVTFDYGSKHNQKEYIMAKSNTAKLNINHIKIDLQFINDYFKSNLLKSGGNIPEGHYEDETMKSTVVPFRNGIMLSIAAGLAESNNLDCIMLANHAGDHVIYPDCRNNFIIPMAEAIKNGTYKNIELFSPYVKMTKRQIAVLGKDLEVDFSMTWSCYKGEDIHCGKCGTCTERIEALEGFDPTIYNL
jgi:7-cyano-7-deazaguanine synthase